ncbi:MAG TPA: ornithine carbamoyltransferase [Azospirillaceae bacterium]|nr:ornithine carbamoyltransferase [Azospirillaceae bacterium]
MSGVPRHFLDIRDFDPGTLKAILRRARDMKGDGSGRRPLLAGRTLAMIFEKPSTRTRVSFEVGMKQLGGEVVHLSSNEMQLGRGETIADTARVLSRYVDVIMLRTHGEEKLHELAKYATVPVVNGLTDRSHPCQIMADILTFEEHRGSIAGKVVAWSGDGNNVAQSFIQAAARFGFELRLACPEPYRPPVEILAWAESEGGRVTLVDTPQTAVRGADLVVTDTWVSMNQGDSGKHCDLFEPYRVDEALMALAKPGALFMHCLPAHRGEEVTDPVIDGPNSVVWDEAENRMHVQKAILCWCLGV